MRCHAVACFYVIYWPSTEPSVKKCTCVNKRKNSGSRWTLDNNITRCLDGLRQGDRMPAWERACRLRALWPSVTHSWATQAKMRKKCCYGQEENLGQYSSPSLSPLISHTQQTSRFRKWSVRDLYKKKCIRSLLKSSSQCDYLSACICITAIQHLDRTQKPLIIFLSGWQKMPTNAFPVYIPHFYVVLPVV